MNCLLFDFPRNSHSEQPCAHLYVELFVTLGNKRAIIPDLTFDNKETTPIFDMNSVCVSDTRQRHFNASKIKFGDTEANAYCQVIVPIFDRGGAVIAATYWPLFCCSTSNNSGRNRGSHRGDECHRTKGLWLLLR